MKERILDRYEEVIKECDEALRLNPKNDYAWRCRRDAKEILGRYEDVILDCDEALRLNSKNDNAWRCRKNAKLTLDQYEKSIKKWDEAIHLNPKNNYAWFCRGNTKLRLARYEEAIKDCDEALRLNPKYDEAWYTRGEAKRGLGRYEEAIKDCNEALHLNSKNDYAWSSRGEAKLMLGRYEEAIKDCDHALQLRPNNDKAWYIRGEAKLQLGRYEEAIKDCEEAFRLNLKNIVAKKCLTEARKKLSDQAQAVQKLNAAHINDALAPESVKQIIFKKGPSEINMYLALALSVNRLDAILALLSTGKVDFCAIIPDIKRTLLDVLVETNNPEVDATVQPFCSAAVLALWAQKIVAVSGNPNGNILGKTPLHIAALAGNLGAIDDAIRTQVPINGRDRFARTALFYAVCRGTPEPVRRLIGHHANPDLHGIADKSPLQIAIEAKNEVIAAMLIEAGAKVNYFAPGTEAPLNMAITHRLSATAILLIRWGTVNNNPDKDGAYPLHLATLANLPTVVSALLDTGANADACLANNITAMHFAASENLADIAGILLAKKATIDCLDLNSRTPFHYAADTNAIDVMRVIVKAGTNINSCDAFRDTALHIACEKGNFETAQFLVQMGGDLDLLGRKNLTPRQLAEEGGKASLIKLFNQAHIALHHESQHDNKNRVTKLNSPPHEKPALTSPFPSSPVFNKTITFSMAIHKDQLCLEKRLGEGSFGEVHKGVWSPTSLFKVPVAIKQLKNTALSAKALEDFKREVEIQAKLESPGIVKLFGITSEQPYCMIMEFMESGSLRDILDSKKPEELHWDLRIQMAVNIATGLAYLHSQNPIIIHGDLKSLNILVNANGQAKLADFGLASLKTESRSKEYFGGNANKTNGPKGSLLWIAPELFSMNAKRTTATDIFSLALVFWEMASHLFPYESAAGNEGLIREWVTTGEREAFDERTPNTPKEYCDLVQRCWDAKPENRPSAKKVFTELETLYSRTSLAPTLFSSGSQHSPKITPKKPGVGSGGYLVKTAMPSKDHLSPHGSASYLVKSVPPSTQLSASRPLPKGPPKKVTTGSIGFLTKSSAPAAHPPKKPVAAADNYLAKSAATAESPSEQAPIKTQSSTSRPLPEGPVPIKVATGSVGFLTKSAATAESSSEEAPTKGAHVENIYK